MTRSPVTITLGLVGILAVGLGTSCATITRAHQTLRPFPPIDCLRAALDSSPDVAAVTREFRGEHGEQGFWVVLRDSTATSGTREAGLFRDPPGDRPAEQGAHIEFSVVFPGVIRTPPHEERAVEAIADRLLRHLQASCAPAMAPTPVVCEHGDGKWKSCAPAG